MNPFELDYEIIIAAIVFVFAIAASDRLFM